ncbi:MAG TPA: amino acid permease [Desulfotomaculum sp.]|nr:amino acid permease [Desulfotomaculum sp.]HBY04446.1 amino acid permease [Desulfotomaculum sp.]
MYSQILRLILGEKLPNTHITRERFNVFWGMPILSSDAVSSVAYAVEEMLRVLVPVLGLAAYIWSPKLAGIIIILLIILSFSYRQIVDAYPQGGGAYTVAKENLSPVYGLVVGASLTVDYILTVAVSISAGTAAITSAIPALFEHKVAIAIFIIVVMIVGNLRGTRESSRLFSLPTYFFIISIISLIITGIIKNPDHDISEVMYIPSVDIPSWTSLLFVFLLMRAFSSGCAAVTGVEAIADSVPNFKNPAKENAKLAYILLTVVIIVCFGGISYLAAIYHPPLSNSQTLLSSIAAIVFGKSLAYYLIQAGTTVILAMAANTAFVGFPTLLSIIARDGFAPRQLSVRGHRLNYSNGIIMLAVAAIVLIIIFQGETHLLIPLYAVGVFTSFTLAQVGVLMRWLKEKRKGWLYKTFINGTGALMTFVVLIIIGVTKFTAGAWIVCLVIPLLVWVMLRIKNHYTSVALELDIPNDSLDKIDFNSYYNHFVIVPIDSINTMVIKALRYARSLTPYVEAFHIETYDGESDKLRKKWQKLNTDIPLVIRKSPYREIVNPLIEYINSEEHASSPNDMITVLLPQFFVAKRWEMLLHNNTSIFVANVLLQKNNVITSFLPFHIKDIDIYKKHNVQHEHEDTVR